MDPNIKYFLQLITYSNKTPVSVLLNKGKLSGYQTTLQDQIIEHINIFTASDNNTFEIDYHNMNNAEIIATFLIAIIIETIESHPVTAEDSYENAEHFISYVDQHYSRIRDMMIKNGIGHIILNKTKILT